MFPDITNWSGIILAILSGFLFLLAYLLSSDVEEVPHDENSLISEESWKEARRRLRNKKW